MHYGKCNLCGKEGIVEEHHAVYRSHSKALRDCKCNLFDLDYNCHRGEKGIHGRDGHKADIKIKKMLQERLFNVLDKDVYLLDEVAEILEVKEEDVRAACKMLITVNGQAYSKEEIIRKLQGGKLY